MLQDHDPIQSIFPELLTGVTVIFTDKIIAYAILFYGYRINWAEFEELVFVEPLTTGESWIKKRKTPLILTI